MVRYFVLITTYEAELRTNVGEFPIFKNQEVVSCAQLFQLLG